MLPAIVLLVPLIVVAGRGRTRPRTGRAGEGRVASHKEDVAAVHPNDTDTGNESEVKELVAPLLGKLLYSYGAGSPKDPLHGMSPKGIHGGRGWDCSGFVQAALVELGDLSSDAGDRGSAALSTAGQAVAWGQQQAGDMAFYGTPVSHIMLVASDADDSGDSEVVGMSGGHTYTNGDDPNACLKLFQTAKYRKDFRFFRRLS